MSLFFNDSQKSNENESLAGIISVNSKENESQHYLNSSNIIDVSNEIIGEKIGINELNSSHFTELDILEIQMDRRVKEKKCIEGGQSSVNYELISIPPQEVAKKNISSISNYKNEYDIAQIIFEKCPFIAVPLVEVDNEKLSMSFLKANYDLGDFLKKSHELFKSDDEKEEFIFQFFYSMIKIIKTLKDIGVIHGDIKPNNIVLMSNIGIGSDFLAIKLIDWGFSIKCQIQKGQTNRKSYNRGFTRDYCNPKYLDFQSGCIPKTVEESEEALYKNEYWCLGNSIIAIIIELYEIDNHKNLTKTEKLREAKEDMSKIRSKVSESLMKIIDFCFCSDILDKLKEEEEKIGELLKTKNILIKDFFNKQSGYRIKIKNVVQFMNNQSNQNPKYLEIIRSNEKEKSLGKTFRNALRLRLSQPPSSFFTKKALLYFTECLNNNEIDKKLNKKSKCCYHLGIELYLILFRRKRLIDNIFFGDDETIHFFEQIFPLDFTKENEMRFQKFISFVDENNVFRKCERLAELGLEYQQQLQATQSKKYKEILQSRFIDFLFILEEIKGEYEKALELQTRHATLLINLKRYSAEKKIKWIFQGSINYSTSALYRIGSKIERIKDEEYINEILKEFDSEDIKNRDKWSLHRKIYKFLFDLRKENEEGSKITIQNVFDYLEKIKIEIDNEKMLPNYMVYLLIDFLENISQSRFKEEFLKDKNSSTFKNPLFSLIELDNEPHEELKEILKRTDEFLKKIS